MATKAIHFQLDAYQMFLSKMARAVRSFPNLKKTTIIPITDETKNQIRMQNEFHDEISM